ncbi:hypothetical protein [Pseudomonas moorei]|uniref:hypothetical protein n=1 Tax=Pseudomonas moorei TaxID=395599 RepID=UPI001FF50032|nr:hypothetical protein [Pseudomonas moorei]
MIGTPMPNPRDSIIANLNQQMDQFFGAGRKVQEVAPGVTGEKDAMSAPPTATSCGSGATSRRLD